MKNQETNEEKDEDLDLALPNDDDDIHKYHQRRGAADGNGPQLYQNNDSSSLNSSQLVKLNRSLDSKTQLVPQSPCSNHIAFVDGKYVSVDNENDANKTNVFIKNNMSSNNLVNPSKILDSPPQFGASPGDLMSSMMP